MGYLDNKSNKDLCVFHRKGFGNPKDANLYYGTVVRCFRSAVHHTCGYD